MQIYRSRFTPGLENVEHVGFDKGDIVKYRCRDGNVINITIDSERKMGGLDILGYEAIFSDDGNRYFAAAYGIIDWVGKI